LPTERWPAFLPNLFVTLRFREVRHRRLARHFAAARINPEE
jgi:hypothetical protein